MDEGEMILNEALSRIPSGSLHTISLLSGRSDQYIRRYFGNWWRYLWSRISLTRQTSEEMEYIRRSFPHIDVRSSDFNYAAHRRAMMDFVVLLARIEMDKGWLAKQDMTMIRKAI